MTPWLILPPVELFPGIWQTAAYMCPNETSVAHFFGGSRKEAYDKARRWTRGEGEKMEVINKQSKESTNG